MKAYQKTPEAKARLKELRGLKRVHEKSKHPTPKTSHKQPCVKLINL